jgi:hypothetical protein
VGNGLWGWSSSGGEANNERKLRQRSKWEWAEEAKVEGVKTRESALQNWAKKLRANVVAGAGGGRALRAKATGMVRWEGSRGWWRWRRLVEERYIAAHVVEPFWPLPNVNRHQLDDAPLAISAIHTSQPDLLRDLKLL